MIDSVREAAAVVVRTWWRTEVTCSSQLTTAIQALEAALAEPSLANPGEHLEIMRELGAIRRAVEMSGLGE